MISFGNGLSDVEQGGRTAEVKLLRDGDEVAQVPELEGHQATPT